MNWFLQNRFLGSFLPGLGLAILLSLWFLLHEKGRADEAQGQLESTVNELNRLRASSPLPNDDNLKKTRAQTEGYRTSLLAFENGLKNRMFPRLPLQPNEFQAQLRLAVTAVQERAGANKVQLPANFNLGFDDYATSLPTGEAAPRLGRQLRAIEWLANTIVDARADALSGLTRTQLAEEKAVPTPTRLSKAGAAAAGASKGTVERIVESTSVDLKFSGSPAAVRRIVNQIASAKDQFYILRTLMVKNQVDKGPKRGAPEAGSTPPQNAAGAKGKEPPIAFIVGTEHLDVAAKVEIVKFAIPETGIR
jgi:hypothetical protein